MATVDLTDVRPGCFAEDRLSPPAEFAEDRLSLPGAPPLAPFGDEDAFLAPEPSRRKLIASTAIVAALSTALLTYFFLASPGAKAPAQSSPILASSPTGVESSSETQVQPSPSPNVPASLTAEGFRPKLHASDAPTPQNDLYGAEPGTRLFAASRCQHQVCPRRKRACSWDRHQGHAVHSYRPEGGLGPGREHPLEGLDQFPISSA